VTGAEKEEIEVFRRVKEVSGEEKNISDGENHGFEEEDIDAGADTEESGRGHEDGVTGGEEGERGERDERGTRRGTGR
jgi:hypothetical protein